MNWHPALEFLTHLDDSTSATFNIEHYTDVPKGMTRLSPDLLAGRHANLTLQQVEALLSELEAVNEKGAGIFVARNQCSGHRSEKNVERVRGLHADMDGVTENQLATVTAHLQPTIVVQSSELGRYQLYWQLAEGEMLGKAETKAMNQCLVTYGADPAAVDVARLLRLPGFKHMKYQAEGRTPTVVAEYPGAVHTASDMRRAFPIQKTTTVGGEVLSRRKPLGMGAPELTRLQTVAASAVAAKHTHLWSGDWAGAVRYSGEIGYPSQSEADLALAGHIARACRNAGIEDDALEQSVEAVFGVSALGRSAKWQSRDGYRQSTVGKALAGLSVNLSLSAGGGVQLESHGDIRNARAFAQVARGRYVYVTTRDQWLQWIGDHWQLCEKDEHFAVAKEACGQILAAAGSVLGQDQDRGRKLVQEAVTAHTLPRMNAMMKLAVSEPEMATTARDLDCDPYVLGVQNGIVDLRTGHHLFNQPEFRITRYCNASFDETAHCSKWLKFLDQIFQGDGATIGSVQRLLGCTLLGLASEEILVVCYGHGSNGKSVFSNVVHNIMGGYSITAPPSLLTARRQDDTGPRNDLAALAGARYVSINEMQAGDRLDEQVVKMLAGREPISARFLHQEYFEFTPTFTPWLRTNHKPIITGEDDGIWRRLALLRFGRKFSDDEKNPHLEHQLLGERDGILKWMVEGARLYLKNGICMSPSMKAELATYRKESDLLGEFLQDHTAPDPAGRLLQTPLYDSYRGWCQRAGVRALSKKSFTQRLAERGHPEKKSGRSRYYAGLTWAEAVPLFTQGDVDGVDGVSAISGNSAHENLTFEKHPNSTTSRPTCPYPSPQTGATL